MVSPWFAFAPPFPLRIFFASHVFIEENVAIACTTYKRNTTSMTSGKGVVSLLNVLLLRRTKIYWGGKQRVGYHRVLELLQVLAKKSFSAKTFTLRMLYEMNLSTRSEKPFLRYNLQCQHSTSQLFPPLLFSVHFLWQ